MVLFSQHVGVSNAASILISGRDYPRDRNQFLDSFWRFLVFTYLYDQRRLRDPFGFSGEGPMHAGTLVFAQVMEIAPWHTFRRLVRSTTAISTFAASVVWTSLCVVLSRS